MKPTTIEQADGRSYNRRHNGYHKFLKRSLHRHERRKFKADPENCVEAYGKYRGYET